MADIYVDFDDCLCETGSFFSELVAEMFGKNIPYEEITDFDMQKSFSLTEEQYLRMMEEGHRPERLLSIEETPGASAAVNSWIESGHNVSVITGRPFSAYEPSREWLDRHGLDRIRLYCLNKYGRDTFYKDSDYSLELEDYYKLHFDFAVEDSPTAFQFFSHLPELTVMVYDRPWNRTCEFPGKGYRRCHGWDTIIEMVPLSF